MTEKSFQASNKKEQFTKKTGRKIPMIIVLLAVVIAGAFGAFLLSGSSGDTAIDLPFGEPVANTRSYIGRVVSMTPVEPLIEAEKVSISLDLLEAYNIVYFEVENQDGFQVPLMAYITPSGRIFTGSSMCEPCQGRYFSLAGETLVCDACRTTYTIESHEFISGSRDCGSYPPVYMKPVVENGMVSIALEDILQWQIRTY